MGEPEGLAQGSLPESPKTLGIGHGEKFIVESPISSAFLFEETRLQEALCISSEGANMALQEAAVRALSAHRSTHASSSTRATSGQSQGSLFCIPLFSTLSVPLQTCQWGYMG